MTTSYTKVAIVGLKLEPIRIVGRFEIHGLPILIESSLFFSLREFFKNGFSSISYERSVLKAEFVDHLYRSKNPHYMSACNRLITSLAGFEIIIFSTYSFIHPEMIFEKLKDKVKVLGFTDDPHSTYVRGIPYLWAFDAAYYISPSYSPIMSFAELFEKLNFKKVRWLPLVQPISYPTLSFDEIKNRKILISYVGAPTGSKIDRLKVLHKIFGDEFHLFGRWRFKGYYGFIRPLFGEDIFPRRVLPISNVGKKALYLDTKIAFNMHVSDLPAECGNMRTYETAGFGMMPLCDCGALNLQNLIFEDKKEAIYYSSIDEAIDIINFYSKDKNDNERSKIAFSAYKRCIVDYSWENTLEKYLNWL